MAQAEIQVELGGGTPEDGLQRYEPGAEIWGLLQVAVDSEVKCNHLRVHLQWHTEGRGDRDEGRIAEDDVFQGVLTPGPPFTREFRFLLPLEPWSYAGHYVNIVWEIAVDVDVPWSKNPRHSQPFVVRPPG